MSQKILAPTAANVARAAQALKKGRLVALPTETVYGLGADASNPQAVASLFIAKGRPADHPVIVHIAYQPNTAQLRSILEQWAAEWPPLAEQLVQAFWPGPLTLIVKRHPNVTPLVSGGQDTIGLRCPAHPVAQALLKTFAVIGCGGIAAPSANRFGQLSPTLAHHVAQSFEDEIECILDGGACEVGIESTIIDVSRGYPVLLRPGQISIDAIERVLNTSVQMPDQQAPRASGTLASHYAPHTPLELHSREALKQRIRELLEQKKKTHIAIYAHSLSPILHPLISWLAAPSHAEDYAHELYAALHTLDEIGAKIILCESVPEDHEWSGVADRLTRAAHSTSKPTR